MTKPLKEIIILSSDAHAFTAVIDYVWNQVINQSKDLQISISASLSAYFHTLSGAVVQAAELYLWDFGILLTAGVPVAVVP